MLTLINRTAVWPFYVVDVVFKFNLPFVLTTTGTTITTYRSKTDLDLCHLCDLCEHLKQIARNGQKYS